MENIPDELKRQLHALEGTLFELVAAIMVLKRTLFEAGITTPAAFDALYQKAISDWKNSPAGQRHELIKKFLDSGQ